MFAGCSNLEDIKVDFSVEKVQFFSGMFDGCVKLTSINLKNFHTTLEPFYFSYNFDNLFAGLVSLKFIDISGIQTGLVTSMENMFLDCKSLTSINLETFQTSRVTSMKGMFKNCENLLKLNLNSFDTSRVSDMSGMFDGCKMLNSLNLNLFNTENVRRMDNMFANMNSLIV